MASCTARYTACPASGERWPGWPVTERAASPGKVSTRCWRSSTPRSWGARRAPTAALASWTPSRAKVAARSSGPVTEAGTFSRPAMARMACSCIDSPARLWARTSCISRAIRLRSSAAVASCSAWRDASTSARRATARSRSLCRASCSMERSARNHAPTPASSPAGLSLTIMMVSPKATDTAATAAWRSRPEGTQKGRIDAPASTGTSPTPSGARMVTASPVPMVTPTPRKAQRSGSTRRPTIKPSSAASIRAPTTTRMPVPWTATTQINALTTMAAIPSRSLRVNVRRRAGSLHPTLSTGGGSVSRGPSQVPPHWSGRPVEAGLSASVDCTAEGGGRRPWPSGGCGRPWPSGDEVVLADGAPGRGHQDPVAVAAGQALAPDHDDPDPDDDLGEGHEDQGGHPGLAAGDVVSDGEPAEVELPGVGGRPVGERAPEAHAGHPQGGGAPRGLDVDVAAGGPDPGQQPAEEAEGEADGHEDADEEEVVAGGGDVVQVEVGDVGDDAGRQEDGADAHPLFPQLLEDDEHEDDVDNPIGECHGSNSALLRLRDLQPAGGTRVEPGWIARGRLRRPPAPEQGGPRGTGALFEPGRP